MGDYSGIKEDSHLNLVASMIADLVLAKTDGEKEAGKLTFPASCHILYPVGELVRTLWEVCAAGFVFSKAKIIGNQ